MSCRCSPGPSGTPSASPSRWTPAHSAPTRIEPRGTESRSGRAMSSSSRCSGSSPRRSSSSSAPGRDLAARTDEPTRRKDRHGPGQQTRQARRTAADPSRSASPRTALPPLGPRDAGPGRNRRFTPGLRPVVPSVPPRRRRRGARSHPRQSEQTLGYSRSCGSPRASGR